MSQYDKKSVELDCPGCKRTFDATYYEIYSRREAKCRRCGLAFKFESSTAHNVQYALRELERAEDKLNKAMQEIFKKAEITIKK